MVRNKAIAAGVPDWLDDLPALVADVAAEWSLRIGDVFPDSTESYVCEATMADGTPAVLKVLMPRDAVAVVNELTTLELAQGHGCARLYHADAEKGALLLERLGRPLSQLGMSLLQRQQVLAATATRMWRPAHGVDLPTGAEKARWLIDAILGWWEELDRPCTAQAVDYAVACAQRRIAAHDDERAMLVHGDVHQWNALEADHGFKLVDPDGLRAEPEYDLGIIMREDPLELLSGDPWERAHRLAALTGCDPVAIWEWGVVERVSTGLLCTQIELQPVGRHMLKAAELVAAG